MASTMHPAPAYRPDIDGLRAFAVLAVLAFHAFPDLLPGGFVGVDVFFTISGFVITRSNLASIRSGTFTWQGFYQRRFRRLMPALATVIACTLAMGSVLLLPGQLEQLGLSALAAAGFVPNLLFWSEAGYFDPAAETKPLLHLWSLGVEEQFYLLWPLAFLLLGRSRWLLPAIWSGVVLSLAYSVWLVAADPTAAFYSPLSRLWELAIGCALALYLTGAERELPGASILGAGMAVLAILVVPATNFPGVWALLPVGAAALLILAGPHSAVNRLVLGHPIAGYIGRISYPLYLWHWPVLVFAPAMLEHDPSSAQKVALVAVSFALASATYHFIERPSWRQTLSRSALSGAIAIGLVGCAGLVIYQFDGLPQRYPPAIQQVLAYGEYEYTADARYPSCWLGNDVPFASVGSECLLQGGTAHSIAIWGDSHAARLYPGLRVTQPADVEIAQLTRNSCPPLLQAQEPRCTEGNAAVLKELRRQPPDTVVLYGAWPNYGPWKAQSALAEAMRATLAELTQVVGREVVVVGPFPRFYPALPDRVYEHWRATGELPDRIRNDSDTAVLDADRELAKLSTDAGVRYVSLIGELCNEQGCLVHLPGAPGELLSWDYGHLTTAGSRFVAGIITTALYR